MAAFVFAKFRYVLKHRKGIPVRTKKGVTGGFFYKLPVCLTERL